MLITNNKQAGLSLVEVLVGLVILSLSVLGFTALQLKAVDANNEAGSRIQAAVLASDLAERIRANPTGIATYKFRLNARAQSSSETRQSVCAVETAKVTATALATCDAAEIVDRSRAQGLTVRLPNCASAFQRTCIYVAWGKTIPQDGEGANDCTLNGVYNPNSNCIVLESY